MSNTSSVSKLDSLSGLEHAKRTVSKLFTSESVHAVLFYGAVGAGKGQLANALAQAWLCPNTDDQGACGICPICLAFHADRCVDFQRVVPLGPSAVIRDRAITHNSRPEEDEDVLQTIPVLEFFRTGPLMARHKVVVLENVEHLMAAAASGLLKTLEEPGPHAKLILTCSSIGSVVPTILSRCLAVACELPSSTDHMSEMELLFSEGAPGLCSQIRHHAPAYQVLLDLFEALPGFPAGTAILAAERFREGSDGLEKSLGVNARAASAEALRVLALWLRKRWPDEPDKLQLVLESHRRILGNANEGVLFDTMFAKLLS